MGKLNFCGYLILQFYPTREIRENLMHTKSMCFTVVFGGDLDSFEDPGSFFSIFYCK